MAITKDSIPLVSPYTVSDAGNFTSALFDYYFDVAEEMLSTMGGDDLTSTTYDHCHALLVAHLYTCKQGTIEIESTADPTRWKWVKPGDTTYLRQVEAIIKAARSSVTLEYEHEYVLRADAGEDYFKLDKNPGVDPFVGRDTII